MTNNLTESPLGMKVGIFIITLGKSGRVCSGNLQAHPYSNKVLMSKSKLTAMFICFFDSRGLMC
jgi:uncharacterized membrane protein (DUF441 family)